MTHLSTLDLFALKTTYSERAFANSQFVLASLLCITIAFPACAKSNRQTATPEQAAQYELESLRSTELKIGHNCEPASWVTKLNLKTLTAQQTKRFWLGQRYAVERTYRNEISAYKVRMINRAADARVAAIEEQRLNSSMATLGVPLPPTDPRLQQTLSEADRAIDAIERDLLARSQEWAGRCYQYADRLSN